MTYSSLSSDAKNSDVDHTAVNSGLVSAAYGELNGEYNCILCN